VQSFIPSLLHVHVGATESTMSLVSEGLECAEDGKVKRRKESPEADCGWIHVNVNYMDLFLDTTPTLID